LIDIEAGLCELDFCHQVKAGEALYKDEGHLSVMGAISLSDRVVPIFQ
jgi:hypothetical protein